MKNTTLIASVSAATLASLAVAHFATGQTRTNQLGKVSFETSCTPAAQEHFNRAMLYQHSF